jgi:hypothetical protein
MNANIIPDPEDFEVVEAMPKSREASDGEKYRLAQEAKIMRLYGPPALADSPNRFDNSDR